MIKKLDFSATRLASIVAPKLERAIQSYPDDFFDSFNYVTPGMNQVHPLMIGELAKIVQTITGVRYVGIDVRLNSGAGHKFHPDVVGFNRERRPICFLDYESPNSSDARIPIKDVSAFQTWSSISRNSAPYLIITTLPDVRAEGWQLRWTGKGMYNEAYKGSRERIRGNPYRFWRSEWQKHIHLAARPRLLILNIDRKRVHKVILGRLAVR